jgi:beta-mannanase
MGVYMGAANASGVASFASQTGTNITIASEYLPSSSGWAGMDGSGGALSWMFSAANGWTGSGYTLSLGVPMIPEDSSGNPLGTLATGATGAYNSYFVTLAQTLVAAGEANAYLRLGWEFDGGFYAWSATTPSTEASFASYFQQIVTAMRSVSGENFKFVWNPQASAFDDAPYNVELAYPGNAYVNYIGLDAYDQSWATPFNTTTAWADWVHLDLSAAQAFAASQSKPIAIPEWGVAIRTDGHGLGDDPSYINNMNTWMKTPTNDVAWESYFNANDGSTNSIITGGLFPNSLAAFKADFG